jgi:hypothetical protein
LNRRFKIESSGIIATVAATVVLLLLTACQYDPFAHTYTTLKPKPEDIVGKYVLTNQTMLPGGARAIPGERPYLELRADGIFNAIGAAPRIDFPRTNYFEKLVNVSGKWDVQQIGTIDNGFKNLQPHWGLALRTDSVELEPVGLMGEKPPYALIFTLGDPDSGWAMLYARDLGGGQLAPLPFGVEPGGPIPLIPGVLFLIAVVGAMAAVVAIGLGIAAVTLGITGVLITVGVLSTSVIAAMMTRRIAVGFKVLGAQASFLLGAPVGTAASLAIDCLWKWKIKWPLAAAIGAFAGALAGFAIAFALYHLLRFVLKRCSTAKSPDLPA